MSQAEHWNAQGSTTLAGEVRPPAPVVQVRQIVKTYGVTTALDHIDFDLRAGEVHALCGHNGAGKSTLVKLLAGLAQPDSGVILIDGDEVSIASPSASQQLGIAVVEQELTLVETLSVADNVLLGHPSTPWLFRRQRHVARSYLDQVGLNDVPLDTPLRELRLGERQLVEIARLLSREARILILDEPTATLSSTEIARVFDVVRDLVAHGRSVVFVTHRLGEVFDFADRVTVVRNGRATERHRTSDIDRTALVSMLSDEEITDPADHDGGEGQVLPMLEVADLQLPGLAGSINLSVGTGQIVALAGQVGAGTVEVIRALAGLDPDADGTVTIDGLLMRLGDRRRSRRFGVAYVSESRASDGLYFGRTSAENLTACSLNGMDRAGWLRISRVWQIASGLAHKAQLAQDRLRFTPETLSGGNQQKLMIGRSLLTDMRDSRILLLSEPSRGVDVHSRAEIFQVLRAVANSGASVLFTSTDLDEIMELGDVVYTFYRGQVQGRYVRSAVGRSQVLADITHGSVQ